MSANRLKTYMLREKKRIIDIASELQISPNTVGKFLNGGRVQPVIRNAIESYLDSKTGTHTAGAEASAG
jgi:transcriptional regulator with XRE-family HTH domain